MKKIFLKGSIVLLGILVLTGCNLGKNETKKKEETEEKKTTQVSIHYKDIETMEKISKLVFEVEKESLKESEFTEDKKSTLARILITKNLEEVKGSELLSNYETYFGKGKKIDFQNVKCNMDHGSEEAKLIYFFDKEKDQYVYNEKHPGHGGGGETFIGSLISLENLTVKEDDYIYEAKILFYGKAICGDIGGCQYGKGYKSYEYAKNENNVLIDIDNSKNYWNQYELPTLREEKLMEDFRNELDTYEFHFEKEDNHLIFKRYNKK
ncbi:MAG: hypothetical protein IKE70_03460 [Bacilli bacterium]|nr:hypothetical protein [Bacilli bacterium]